MSVLRGKALLQYRCEVEREREKVDETRSGVLVFGSVNTDITSS